MSNLTRYARNGLFPRDPFALARELFANDAWPVAVAREPDAFAPQFNVKETENAYVITADLPGVKEEDLDLSLTGNHLTVSGKREAESKRDEENFHIYERRFGSFSRSFLLPDEADGEAVAADLKDGVLVLSIAKKSQAKPKKITIKKN